MRFSALILIALTPLFTGCVATELRVENQTAVGVYVYSGHTKKVTTIPADTTASVPHSSGEIIVVTQRDQVWEYDDIRSVVDEAVHSFMCVTLHIRIEPDGSIEMPGGKILTPSRVLAGS